MEFLKWAISPWGQRVPIHIAWFLIWVAVIAGFLFFIVHATYLRYFAKPKEFASSGSPLIAARIPEHVPRHSLTARLFHWIMAASMFTLLFTAFLPKVGMPFDWVTYHWIAGSVLTVSILFTRFLTAQQHSHSMDAHAQVGHVPSVSSSPAYMNVPMLVALSCFGLIEKARLNTP